MREDEKSLYKATSQVDQMYNLLQQYEVKIPSEDLVLHEDLHERQQEYRHEIEFAQSYRDMKMPEMITAVDSNLIKLQDNINVMVSKLEDPMFNEMDNYFDSEKVLEELVAVGSRLENADQLAKTYGSYQKLFNVTMTSQKELEVGKEKWETLKLLWECIAKWNERYKYWLETQFTDLNAEGMI
jgi:DNA repair ATPase RecN